VPYLIFYLPWCILEKNHFFPAKILLQNFCSKTRLKYFLFLAMPAYKRLKWKLPILANLSSRVIRLGNFCLLGYFWGLIMIFWNDEVAQNNGVFLGYFVIKQIYYIFTSISSFKTWFAVDILRFLKWFDVDVLGFQI